MFCLNFGEKGKNSKFVFFTKKEKKRISFNGKYWNSKENPIFNLIWFIFFIENMILRSFYDDGHSYRRKKDVHKWKEFFYENKNKNVKVITEEVNTKI